MCLIVPDDCEEPICGGNVTAVKGGIGGVGAQSNGNNGPLAQARAFEPRADALLQPAEDGALMASYSVFVVEPGASVGEYLMGKSSVLAKFFQSAIIEMTFFCLLCFSKEACSFFLGINHKFITHYAAESFKM